MDISDVFLSCMWDGSSGDLFLGKLAKSSALTEQGFTVAHGASTHTNTIEQVLSCTCMPTGTVTNIFYWENTCHLLLPWKQKLHAWCMVGHLLGLKEMFISVKKKKKALGDC